jgi:hypothetical protein
MDETVRLRRKVNRLIRRLREERGYSAVNERITGVATSLTDVAVTISLEENTRLKARAALWKRLAKAQRALVVAAHELDAVPIYDSDHLSLAEKSALSDLYVAVDAYRYRKTRKRGTK